MDDVYLAFFPWMLQYVLLHLDRSNRRVSTLQYLTRSVHLRPLQILEQQTTIDSLGMEIHLTSIYQITWPTSLNSRQEVKES